MKGDLLKIILAAGLVAMTASCSSIGIDTKSRTVGHWKGYTSCPGVDAKGNKTDKVGLELEFELKPSTMPLLSHGVAGTQFTLKDGRKSGAWAEANGEADLFGGGTIVEKKIVKTYGVSNRWFATSTKFTFTSDTEMAIEVAHELCPVAIVLTKQEH